eukprot:UN30760
MGYSINGNGRCALWIDSKSVDSSLPGLDGFPDLTGFGKDSWTEGSCLTQAKPQNNATWKCYIREDSCPDETTTDTETTDTESCDDGTQNQDEEGVDCGGVCPECETCDDGRQNQDEEGVDCGGVCPECETCDDGRQNQDEEGVDCGGVCQTCDVGVDCVDFWSHCDENCERTHSIIIQPEGDGQLCTPEPECKPGDDLCGREDDCPGEDHTHELLHDHEHEDGGDNSCWDDLKLMKLANSLMDELKNSNFDMCDGNNNNKESCDKDTAKAENCEKDNELQQHMFMKCAIESPVEGDVCTDIDFNDSLGFTCGWYEHYEVCDQYNYLHVYANDDGMDAYKNR